MNRFKVFVGRRVDRRRLDDGKILAKAGLVPRYLPDAFGEIDEALAYLARLPPERVEIGHLERPALLRVAVGVGDQCTQWRRASPFIPPVALGHPQQLPQGQRPGIDADGSGDEPDIAPRIVSSTSIPAIRVSMALTAASIIRACVSTARARSARPRWRKKSTSSS